MSTTDIGLSRRRFLGVTAGLSAAALAAACGQVQMPAGEMESGEAPQGCRSPHDGARDDQRTLDRERCGERASLRRRRNFPI